MFLSSFDLFEDFVDIPIEEIIKVSGGNANFWKNDEIILEVLTAIYDFHTNSNDTKTIPMKMKVSSDDVDEVEFELGRRSIRRSIKDQSQKVSPEMMYINPQSVKRKRFHSSQREWAKDSNKKGSKMNKRSNSERREQLDGSAYRQNQFGEDCDDGQLTENQREAFSRKTERYNQQLLSKSSKRVKSQKMKRNDTIEIVKKHIPRKVKEDLRKASISKISKLNKNRSRKKSSKKAFSVNFSAQRRNKSKRKRSRRSKRESSIKPMQKPMDVEIDPISKQDVKRVKNWLLDHLFCSSITNFKTLHAKAKNGGFIFDLINKTERKAVLKGKNVSKATCIKVNYRKIMDHLRQYEKFNPRYFNAAYYLINGHYEVFWGLLYDIYCYYNNKVSKYDRRYSKNSLRVSRSIVEPKEMRRTYDSRSKSPELDGFDEERSKRLEVKKQSKSKEDMLFFKNYSQSSKYLDVSMNSHVTSKRNISHLHGSKSKKDNPQLMTLSSLIEEQNKNPVEHDTYSVSNNPRGYLLNNKYSNENFPKERVGSKDKEPRKLKRNKSRGGNSYMKSFIKKKKERHRMSSRGSRIDLSSGSFLVERRTNNSRFVDLEVEKDSVSNLGTRSGKIDYQNLAKLESNVKKWLKTLGFNFMGNKHLFDDPLRNGYILCLLASRVYECNISGVCKKPKTIRECMKNVETAFIILRDNKEDYPYDLLWKSENVVQGDPAVIWPLLQGLKTVYNKVHPVSGGKSDKISSKNIDKLPYTLKEIELLQDSLLLWFISLGLFNQDQLFPANFEEVMMRVNDGLLLVRLVETVLNKKIKGIHWRPNGRSNCIHNIRKALDELKNCKRMSRRFLWKVEKIYERDFFTCLGLFEDIHIFGSGLPRRRDPDYFKNGPYIVKLKSVNKMNNDPLGNPEARLQSQIGSTFTYKQNANPLNYFTNRTNNNLAPAASNFSTNDIKNLKSELIVVNNSKSEIPKKNQNFDSVGDFKSEMNFSALNQNKSKKGGSRAHLSAYNGKKEIPVMLDTFAKTDTFSTSAIDLITTEDLENYASGNDDSEPLDFNSIKKVIRLLVYLDMPKIIERETWDSSTWTQFSDG